MTSSRGQDKDSSYNEASREARRFLTARVRNDWDYPALPEHRQPPHHPLDLQAKVDGPSDNITTDDHATSTWDEQATEPLSFEPIAWRERGYSSSEFMTSEQSASEFMDLDDHDKTPKAGKRRYLFDSPDTVAQTVAARRETRKRKRAQVLEEEMTCNPGLAHFVARRNAWTCARLPSASQITAAAPDPAAKLHARPASSSRASGDSLNSSGDKRSFLSTPASSPPPLTEPGLATLHTMLPIPEPLLQDNPVRAKINTAAYGEIYSKIIVQCRTPTVPINLSDVTKACVRGWIAEGNWPPKPGAPDPLIGRAKVKGERHPHLRKGVQAVSRVFGLGASEDKEKERR
ncbi:hypothetical protein K461DRAFT_268880 [Myriangium duriaei CBS 260.36]|uniref:Gag1-like clamp domain-containing protein n=1 Tax=Myriangium duriaei CBS 260.36 TaxID=1168546 RepID=A0A9P4IZF2_9PEZI|nr:hypothetical protein K461DRAFT_268880 [Myriangium duriaei CBS 260.36]